MSFKGFDDVHTKDDHAEFEPKISRKIPREKLLKSNKKTECSNSLPASCRLTQQDEPTSCPSASEGTTNTIDHQSTSQTKPTETSQELVNVNLDNGSSPVAPTTQHPTNLPSAASSTEKDIRLTKLEEFQSKQKLIEEQNRKRRELLAQAIISRKRQTDQETKKLELVQVELAQIDLMLNNDVKFLRNSIEQVSLEFMEAQKRYDRAEKEFVSSKLHLFATLERKELMTDHLCAIIEQNELRKAKKLEELMLELSLSPDTSDTTANSLS